MYQMLIIVPNHLIVEMFCRNLPLSQIIGPKIVFNGSTSKFEPTT
jgi:hypothetical protein